MNKNKKTILITGASSGLGLSITKLLMQLSEYILILTARETSLNRFEQENIFESNNLLIRPLDVTNREQRKKVVEEIVDKFGCVDVLINNAGFTYRAVIEHVTEDEKLKQMEINFRAPMELIRVTLPAMRKKREGLIINISSVGGMMAMPTMAIYSASKFALEGASEALWYEVKPWNINVVLVEPGFIHSNSFLKVRMTPLSKNELDNQNAPYHFHYKYMANFIEKMMKLSPATPKKIAKKVLKIIKAKNPPLRVRATLDATFFAMLRRFLPRKFYHWFLYKNLPGIKYWGQ